MLLIVFGYACSWELYCPPQVTNTTHPYMQLLRRPPRLRKGGRSSTTLPFLGITLDTIIKMEARLPEDKFGRLREEIAQWITCKKAKKARNYPYCGLTATCSQCRLLGKSLPLPMYTTAAKPKEIHYFTKLDVQFRSNICWWHTFLTEWNGVSLLRWDNDNWTPDYCIQTDASVLGVVEPLEQPLVAMVLATEIWPP